MASTGDAPPPPPQPEELTTSALLSLITSPNSADHLTALTIIRDAPSIYIEITPYLNGLFTRSILNTPDAALRSMAREALIALAGEVARRGDVPIIASLFSPLIRTVIASVQDLPTDRADGSCTILLLTNLASALPQAIIPHLAAITNLCHEIANSDATEELRGKAINLLVTLTTVAPESIPDTSLHLIVDACLTTMGNVDERITDAAWLTNEAVLDKESLRQIVSNLHERGIVGVILQKTREFLLYDDWTCRFAAVTALELIGTAGRIQMIDEIVHNLTFALKDSDARVRETAYKAIHRMAPNFEPTSNFLNDVLPFLVTASLITRPPAHPSKIQLSCSNYAVVFIAHLATVLGARFAPYVKDAAMLLINNLQYSGYSTPFHRLLSCIRHEGTASVRSQWEPYWAALKRVISASPRSNCWRYVGNMAQCLDALESGVLTTNEVKEFGEVIKEVMGKEMDRDGVKTGGKSSEEKLMDNINPVIYNLFMNAGPNCYIIIHDLFPILFSSMKSRAGALLLSAHYSLNVPQLSFTAHRQLICPLILQSLRSDYAATRCEAAYALGNVAMNKCIQWKMFLASAIPSLITEINRPDAMTDSNHTLATEMMVSAAAKIINNSDRIDGANLRSLINSFCQWLHSHCIEEDTDESPIVYDVLTHLIEAKHRLVLGHNNEHWPKLIKALLKALSHRALDDSTEGKRVRGRLEAIVKNIKVTEENFNSIVEEAKLDDGEKKILASLIC